MPPCEFLFRQIITGNEISGKIHKLYIFSKPYYTITTKLSKQLAICRILGYYIT